MEAIVNLADMSLLVEEVRALLPDMVWKTLPAPPEAPPDFVAYTGRAGAWIVNLASDGRTTGGMGAKAPGIVLVLPPELADEAFEIARKALA